MKRTYTHPTEPGRIIVAMHEGLTHAWLTITYADGDRQAMPAARSLHLLHNAHNALLAEGYTLQAEEA